MIVDHLENYYRFSDFHCGSWSSASIAYLLTFVSGRIGRTFNKSCAALAVVLFTNLSLMEFQMSYIALFLLFFEIDGFRWV